MVASLSEPVPEVYGFHQSKIQAFYFVESASIGGKPLDDLDVVIAYNGDVVVGARYWNGEYTDVQAMGINDYVGSQGYCSSGDKVTFKVLDASSNELIHLKDYYHRFHRDLLHYLHHIHQYNL